MAEKEHEEKKEAAEGGQRLYCPECGEEVGSDIKFCPKCGASLRAAVRPRIRVRERKPPRPDVLGFVSAGVVLMVIAAAYLRNPIEPSAVISYFEAMGKQGAFIKPPAAVFDLATFFFYAVGTWGIVLSGLRIVFERRVGKALGDLVGALFSFSVAFLLSNYAADVFTGRETLAYFVMAIGLLVIVNAAIYFAFRED